MIGSFQNEVHCGGTAAAAAAAAVASSPDFAR